MKKHLFQLGILAMTTGISNLALAQQYVEKKITENNGNVSLVTFRPSAGLTSSSVNQLFDEVLKISSGFELKLIKSETDFSGKFTDEKYQLYYKGIKVESGIYNLHYKNGSLTSMNGEVFHNVSEFSQRISASAAFEKAVNYIGAEKYMWQDEVYSKKNGYQKPSGELVYIPVLQDDETYKLFLTYKFDIYASQPLTRDYVFVDAASGRVVAMDPIMKHARKPLYNQPSATISVPEKSKASSLIFPLLVSGTADTRYSGTRDIETTFSTSGNQYILHDTTRGNGVRTLNLREGSMLSSAVEFRDDDNIWSSEEHDNEKFDNAALDAHWGVEKTYDYFYSKFGRNSYDGNGAILRSYVHYGSAYENAGWTGSEMVYGDGASTFSPLTAFDVTAHELGHGVCSSSANLLYQRESGALNEALSDIWGAAVEYTYAPEKDPYLIGEDIAKVSPYYLRSLRNPKVGLTNQPDTYRGINWYPATVEEGCINPSNWTNDNCGVHINSGVINHWFYILSEGKTGTNDHGKSYNVTGIGIDKAAEIAYRLETTYLTPNSNFMNARNFGIQCAIDLFGEHSDEHKATQDAFYAVGLGPKYLFPPDVTPPSAPSDLTANNITGSRVSLVWTAATDENDIGGYTIYRDGTSIANVGENILTYNVTGLNADTTYQFYVTASDAYGNVSSESNTVEVKTLDTPDYCDSSGNSTSDERIARVQFADIDNPSTGAAGYEDFTHISTDVIIGESNTITITPYWSNITYNEGYSVFIDLNQDGDFNDSGERIFFRAPTTASSVSGEITIPETAKPGTTRMRVVMAYNSSRTNPCGVFEYGQVEDYTLNIIDENLSTIGISADSKIALYPNPVKDIINISGKIAGEFDVKVYDASGKLFHKASTSDKKLNVSRLSAGSYIIELTDQSGIKTTRKFIKQ